MIHFQTSKQFFQKLRIFPVFNNKTIMYEKRSSSILQGRSLVTSRTIQVRKNSCLERNQPNDASTASSISRTEIKLAQKALFDYLHCTRCLDSGDAEFMSKNSPVFLQNILSKVGTNQEIYHSVTRFLRYHPINEFEMLFESMGLKQSQIAALLPRELMFLTDDEILLENYHCFCAYGVPRSKLGKIYVEEKGIFRYNFGVLSSKLRAYEELGLEKSFIVKLVTCSPLLLVGDINKEFIRLLEELKTLGFETAWIKVRLRDTIRYNWKNLLGIVSIMYEIGCKKEDLGRLIQTNPDFLFGDLGTKVFSMFTSLLKLGLKDCDILRLFLTHPHILARNFMRNLGYGICFLFKIGMKNEDIAEIFVAYPQVLGSCSFLKHPRIVLSTLNIDEEDLREMIKNDPNELMKLASHPSELNLIPSPCKTDGVRLLQKSNFLLNVGFIENSDEMDKALKKFRGRGDELQERFDCLVNAGLDVHDVSNMIKLFPDLLNQSKDVLEKKIDCLLNTLGYPLESLVDFPTFLGYGVDRIKLRISMYRWLEEKGAIRSKLALSSIVASSDSRFLKSISLHPEGSIEWERLKKESCISSN